MYPATYNNRIIYLMELLFRDVPQGNVAICRIADLT